MEIFTELVQNIAQMRKRQLIQQIISFGLVVATALMIWNTLRILTSCESPIVVVLSGSMEPAFRRGDLLFLTQDNEAAIRIGEIVVYKLPGREIPIVHRVLDVHECANGTVSLLTKGDNNQAHDRSLYWETDPNLHWLNKDHIVGRAKGYLPFVGMVTIAMTDYPYIKYGMIVLMALLVIVNRE
jgi:signal peptidase